MSEMHSQAVETILWLRPDQDGLARALVSAAKLRVVAVGCSDPTRTAELASGFSAKPVSDIRSVVATTQGNLILMLHPGSLGAMTMGRAVIEEARLDADELAVAMARGVKIASMEPLPPTLLQLSESCRAAGLAGQRGVSGEVVWPVGFGQWCAMVPMLRSMPRIAEARELLNQLGSVRSVSIVLLSPSDGPTVGTLVVSAMDLARIMLGDPESICGTFAQWREMPSALGASLANAKGEVRNSGRGIHIAQEQTLRDLAGDVAASLRYTDGRGATISVSSHAATWSIQVTIVATGGVVQIVNDQLRWTDSSGHSPDKPGAEDQQGGVVPGESLVREMSMQIRRYVESGVSSMNEMDYPRVLAMAEAALLSSRTGEPENPGTMLRMAGL